MKDYRSIPAFCINIDERKERWAQAQGEFKRLNWPVARVSAVVYEKPPIKGLSKGHAGALDSHKKTWRMILEEDCDEAAVFEDDAVFPSDFAGVFPKAYAELPKDWRLWHLHSFGPQQMKRIVMCGTYITKLVRMGWGAHGYLVRREFLPKMIDLLEKRKMNDDVFLTSGLRRAGFQPYGTAPRSTLCLQRGEGSDIPETSQIGYWRRMKNAYMR